MTQDNRIFVGGGGNLPMYLALGLANRHGLVTGATGTGKTVSLQILAEGFSAQGVPVFMADVKGDLSGISQPGVPKKGLEDRAIAIGMDGYGYRSYPVIFWDLLGEQGHPVRTTVSDMGPLLLSRLLELNDTQEGVLNIVFKVADDEGLLLLDFADLKSLLQYVGDNSSTLTTRYGNVSSASVGAIQRRLLVLEQQGGAKFFGEPALDLYDMMRVDHNGYGFINILAADVLMQRPRLYATFLLWLLAELFEELPEVGDPEKPRLVFFFDEAHLLFDDAPKPLLEKVEQVVRLIRSKGVGVYFVTQNPLDIPDQVLGQLGNRIQHALRAYTPRDQKAIRAAAQTFRVNPGLDTERVITELGLGEALVSLLEDKGVPSIVQRTLIRPPSSRLGPVSADERKAVIGQSPIRGRYENVVDRMSAHENLRARAEQAEKRAAAQASEQQANPARKTRERQGVVETMAKSVASTIGRGIGQQIVRGILGSIFKGR